MTRPRQTVTHVPIDQLIEHPANIRDNLGDLNDMAASIREHGVLQPLTATEDPDRNGKLLLLAGHRRLGASRLAGLTSLPVIIRHGLADPAEHLVVMLVENTHRRDLNPVERAEAYGALRNRGLSTSDIARRTGTQPSTVSYYLNLLVLDEEERDEIRSGQRSSTEAIAEVREARQEQRAAEGKALRGRPKRKATGSYFGVTHRLARAVRELCDHDDRLQVGGVGCGPCWERLIVSDAASTDESRESRVESRESRVESSTKLSSFGDSPAIGVSA